MQLDCSERDDNEHSGSGQAQRLFCLRALIVQLPGASERPVTVTNGSFDIAIVVES